MKLYYEVTDNSYSADLNTFKHTFLVQKKSNCYSPDSKEDGAEFEIISAPFDCNVKEVGETYTYTFIVVKSTKTGICYRVLYNKKNVYCISCREYIFR